MPAYKYKMQPTRIRKTNIPPLPIPVDSNEPSTKEAYDASTNIMHFTSKQELLYGLIDIVEAHHQLILKGIHRSEIHINNLILHYPQATSFSEAIMPRNGMREGYLINCEDTENNTDTLAFRALDILLNMGPKSKINRQPHHDLESIFYILLWVCVNCAGPRGQPRGSDFNITRTSLHFWYTGPSHFWIGTLKRDAMLNYKTFEDEVLVHCSPYFTDLKPVLRRLRVAFFDQVRMKRKRRVTHDEMVGILRKALKDVPSLRQISA